MGAATMFGSSINESSTIVLPAGAQIENARGIALAVSGGKVIKPATKGDVVIGLAIIETDETVEAGEKIDIQIKNIGKMVAGEEIAIGDELTADENGHAVKAAAGNFIIGYAVSNASEAGTYVQVQITKSGYKA